MSSRMEEPSNRTTIPDTQCQKPRPSTSSISMYSVQCNKCLKWRLISTQEEYEEIRENLTDDPWFCFKKSGLSCKDPADIEYDDSRTWIMDKPSIPKTPDGFKKILVVRSDYSRCDVYYLLPTGKKARTTNDIQKFLDENPKFRSKVDISDFSFTVPKVMEETIPGSVEGKASASKKIKT